MEPSGIEPQIFFGGLSHQGRFGCPLGRHLEGVRGWGASLPAEQQKTPHLGGVLLSGWLERYVVVRLRLLGRWPFVPLPALEILPRRSREEFHDGVGIGTVLNEPEELHEPRVGFGHVNAVALAGNSTVSFRSMQADRRVPCGSQCPLRLDGRRVPAS